MPWFYNWRRRNYRRPWYRRRRPRQIIRRRRFPRRRRVRYIPQKLKRITIKQWQPPTIKKCHIKGMINLIYYNELRIPWNSTMYELSTVPEKNPGGGGFCVMQFNLDNLYSMHQHCSNWWTASNDNLPLCRYIRCKIKCYQSAYVDYIVKYSTALPGRSNKLTYPACQPSMLLMSNQKVIVPSKETRKLRKPYKVINISPPAQFNSGWYFQKDISKIPLVTIHAATCSLDHYYTGTDWDSNNITITCLNTDQINNRNFKNEGLTTTTPWPYKIQGTVKYYYWFYRGPKEPPTDTKQIEVKYLIPLQQCTEYKLGSDYDEAKAHHNVENVLTYTQKISTFTGNPFMKEYIEEPNNWFFSTTSAQGFATAWNTEGNNENAKVDQLPIGTTKMQLTKLDDSIIWHIRYNPLNDSGQSTKMYLLKLNRNGLQDWDEPDNDDYILEGFPMWLNIYGFVDFQIKLGAFHNINTDYILCIKNHETKPRINKVIIPLNDSFTKDKSPYLDYLHPADALKWHPQLDYQRDEINNIAKCGPGTPKIGDRQSDEVKIKYDFYFKWGGSPAKMITVDNPIEQAIYPIPRNLNETTTLQGPAQSFESLLYSFDERYNQLTQTAIDRITKDWSTKEILHSITEPTREVPVQQTLETQIQQATTSKETEETLQQLLLQQRLLQRQLKHRITQLLQKIQNLE
nr:MAG: ORF1 [TTV-like mini virus]